MTKSLEEEGSLLELDWGRLSAWASKKKGEAERTRCIKSIAEWSATLAEKESYGSVAVARAKAD